MMNGYHGWSKSLTEQRKGYFDTLEITEPIMLDNLNVTDINIFDNASRLNLNFSTGKNSNLSGSNCSYSYFNI